MKLLINTQIKTSILNCNPEKIATAYLGNDYKLFIPNQ